MIYHLLTESEPFSEHSGGALSRWTANVLRQDDDSTVVCPSADSTWNFATPRIWRLPGFQDHSKYFRTLRYHTALHLRLLQLRRLFRPLVQKLRSGDLVYIHNRPEYALALRANCLRRGVRLVLHMQNSHLRFLPKRYGRQLAVDALVFCSSFLQQEPLEFTVHAGQSVVIPNGADDTCFFPDSDATAHTGLLVKPVALFVGRLVPEKGAHIFIEAMRILHAKGISVTGRIVGSAGFGGQLSSAYVHQLKLNAPADVEFADYVSGPALADEFRRAHIFCCPSTWDEPFGMVNVEAMATALPVIATKVGGIPEIFREGGGLLIPSNSAKELADAIELLLKDANKRRQLSVEGYRAFQKHFHWQQIRSQYRGLVDNLSGAA